MMSLIVCQCLQMEIFKNNGNVLCQNRWLNREISSIMTNFLWFNGYKVVGNDFNILLQNYSDCTGKRVTWNSYHAKIVTRLTYLLTIDTLQSIIDK